MREYHYSEIYFSFHVNCLYGQWKGRGESGSSVFNMSKCFFNFGGFSMKIISKFMIAPGKILHLRI